VQVLTRHLIYVVYNGTFKTVRVTTVRVEKKRVLHILNVCL